MAAVKEFALPDLGEGLTEAEIVRWMVEVGDVVEIDQPVVEVETAKAMVEVPCPYAGVVTARYGDPGDEVPVGRPLVTVAVGDAGDGDAACGDPAGAAPQEPADRARLAAGATAQAVAVDDAGGTAGSGSGNVLVGYGTAGAAPRRRRVRMPADGVDTGTRRGTGRADDAPAAPLGPVAVVSPLVRRLARENGVDLRTLRGTGSNGLVLRADVERAVADAATASASAAKPVAVTEGETRVPLRGVRGAVAEKLSRSRREIPDATTWVDADATGLLAARAAMNAGHPDRKVSVLALLARICTAALARYPELNAVVDTASNEIVRLAPVHVGFAAQTDRGLVVPVIRDAHARTTEDLAAEIGRLTAAARDGKLSPADLTGGTFTLNNYGVFGVDGSTPIINHPEAAMLGVGRIAAKPWVVDGELAVRQVVQLSFTFDHRVCDGGTAGGFLRYVADCVESPALLLRSI
ncbi:dihydrolipoamide acetyltransferase family protein [Streptantibioticus silvisoli]|uniref:Dihydrolipoamide acetyltransferase component of pyruvate dehydrogenase complex n=1 Tax=Streptantibioticus silvisoli TaxID=2705255 RepID=A0ABT6W1K4_9ACTN|nr:dihydrolipoamide acetyltransferase family protein [Streptantibioticus silvisoli]MDI5964285.1 dihydrolipoamide acetyltransferase family protein [Streptantibioticus silvisoli]